MGDVCLTHEEIRQSLEFVSGGEGLAVATLELADSAHSPLFQPDLLSLMRWESKTHQLHWLALGEATGFIALLLLPLYAEKLQDVIRRWNRDDRVCPISVDIRGIGIDDAVSFYESAMEKREEVVSAGLGASKKPGRKRLHVFKARQSSSKVGQP